MNRSEKIYNAYDTIIIFKPTLTDITYDVITTHYHDLLSKLGCLEIKHTIIGKKKLACTIKGCEQGYYMQFSYISTPDAVECFEQNLREDENTLKFISIKTESNVEVEVPDINPESEQNSDNKNKTIDAMDVLLGLAKYN